jgi:opacity protein-like surface antigen
MRAPNYAVAVVLHACAWVVAATVGVPARADDTPFSWTGFYVGAHTGAAMDYNDFSNPYGATLFGDEVRSPGPFLGGQGGYNYQFGQTVLGIDVAASWADLTGVATCMQPAHSVPGIPGGFIGGAFGGTCQAQVDAFGTIAAKAGYVLGAQDRILVYGKGGLAWMHNDVTAAQNNALGGAGPESLRSDTKYWQWGWMLGGGLEYALTNRWSLGFEYDYLRFGEHQIATPRTTVIGGDPGLLGAISMDGRPADLSQDLHVAKLSVNYALEDRGAVADSFQADSAPTVPDALSAPGFAFEAGGRFVYGWTRFQKDLGNEDAPLPTNNSRLIYDSGGTNGLEFYGRIDSPWNVMLKGVVGVGRGHDGWNTDEDWGIARPGPSVWAYSISKSDADISLNYFTLDLGYDLRAGAYRVAPFVGYNYFAYKMNALGCTRETFVSPQPCRPVFPPTLVGLQEADEWRSLRLGTVAELMLTSQLKLTGEVAYLPYVRYAGVDNHPLRADALGNTRSPARGVGTGVQLEGIVSYDVSDEFSVGVGGRFWAMTTPHGLMNFFSEDEFISQRYAVEQGAVFAQGSYKFDAR